MEQPSLSSGMVSDQILVYWEQTQEISIPLDLDGTRRKPQGFNTGG